MKYAVFSVQDHHPEFSRSLQELYEQVMQQAILADELGYDTFYVAEHHFHEYGAVPNPAVFLAAVAQRTKRIRLAPAISILTFHHPLTVAENYAMLDLLSGGRVTLGVGSGYLAHEFDGYGIEPSGKRDRFDEHLHVLEQALSGKRFSFSGKHITVSEVQLNVRSVQPGGIPLVVAVLRAEAAFHVGRQGRSIVSVPYASVDSFEEIKSLTSDYRKGFQESGKENAGKMTLAFHTHVAATDAEARERAEEAFDLYVRTRLYARRQTWNDIQQSGLGLFGSAETVAAKIRQLKAMGIDELMLLMNFGMLDPAAVEDSMRRFMRDVVPLV